MKTKKTVFTVLTAALVTAFVIGCNVPLEITNVDVNENQSVSVGKTKVRLNIMNSNSSARTVRPASLPTAITDFNKFKLTIVDSDDGGINIDFSGAGGVDYSGFFNETDLDDFEVELDVGDVYTFTLTGYNSSNVALARGVGTTSDPLSSTETVNIILKEIVDGIGTGKFAWDVDTTFTDPLTSSSTSYGTATLQLIDLSDDSPVILEVPSTTSLNLLTGGNNDSDIVIPSGYYRMVITLGKTYYQTVYVQEIVHIFAGFTSTYNSTLPALRSTRHTITYDYISTDPSNSGNPASEYLNHGVTFSTLTSLTSKPAHSDSSNYIFEKWYREYDSGDVGNELKQALVLTDLAIKPITLYAGWMHRSAVTVDITPSVAFTTPYNPALSASISSFDQSASTFTITIVVNNPGTYDTFVLYKDDNLVTPLATGVPVATTVEFTITKTLNSSNVNWWQEGDHIVTLMVSDSGDPFAEPNSAEYTITCSITP